MRRFLVLIIAVLATVLSSILISTPMRAQVGVERDLIKLKQEQKEALDRLSANLTEVNLNDNSVPSWLMGELGPANGKPKSAAVEAMRRLSPVFRGTADDQFEPKSELADELGQVHVRLQQRYRGLRVVGGELIVHMQGNRTIGVNGHYVPDLSVEETPALSADAAIGQALSSISGFNSKKLSSPELVVFVTEQKTARLAWSQVLSYVGADGESQIDRIFADARTGEFLDRHPQIRNIKDRKIYDAKEQCYTGFNFILPGTFLFGEKGPDFTTTDEAAIDAYDATGKTYDFYYQNFKRDSYDNQGSSIISTVHTRFAQLGTCSSNNAGWVDSIGGTRPGDQLVYGDGDGQLFASFPKSFDTTAHEFTHGVTQSTAGLIYRGESGAIDEATSDILGECAEAYIKGDTDWQIAEDIYTPNIPGDALRYMYDPAKDGISADFYPDVFPSNCAAYANCEVHSISGIANLAFFLLVRGGTHPRGKSTVVVPAIGIKAAQQIWYRALTVYMTSGTDFADARDTTMHAASDLFGGPCNSNVGAVDKAWLAVGVFGPPSPSVQWQCGGFNILRNPGFEATGIGGAVPTGQAWIKNEGPGSAGLVDFYPHYGPPHSGYYLATIVPTCSPNPTMLYQQVTIPSSMSRATLSFWLHITTDEPKDSPQDVILRVQLRDTANNVLTTLATYTHFDANTDYVKKSFDVSRYRGQTVRVYFEKIISISYPVDCSHSTYFFIDDTALIVE